MADKIENFKLVCRGGLNSNENHLDLADTAPGSAIRLVNYEPSLFGGYRRIEGYQPYDDLNPVVGGEASEGRVLGLSVYRNEGIGNPYVIAARKDAGADTYRFWRHVPLSGWVDMEAPARTFPAIGNVVGRVRHVQFDFGSGNELVFVDGVNSPIKWDGVDWVELSGEMMPPKPAVVEVFENHLFLAGDIAYPSMVAHSAPQDATDWTAAAGAGQLTLGFPVVQIKPFRDNLFVFGSNAIKKVSPDVEAAFISEQVTANVGCIARDSVQEIGGDLVFLAPDGIRPVAGTSRIGDVELETISRDIQGRLRSMIRDNDLDTLTGVVVRSKSQVRFFVGDDSIDRIDSLGVMGGLTQFEGNIKWEFSDLLGIRASVCTSEYVGREEFVLHGDYDGTVYRQEMGTSLAGDDIVSIYSTPFLDFGDTEIRKTLHKVNTFVRAEGSFEANISIVYDWGDPSIVRPASYNSIATGTPTEWGGRNVVYGGTEVVYGGNNRPVIMNDIQGSGFSASLTFVTVGTSKSHTIQGLVFEFSAAGKR